MSLSERQTELVETHRAIQDAGLPYVLVGGWTVSAFQTRFTTDIDTVIPATAIDDYDSLFHRGDSDKLAGQIETVLDRLQRDGFEDSFTGVFRQKSVPVEAVEELVSFLCAQRDRNR